MLFRSNYELYIVCIQSNQEHFQKYSFYVVYRKLYSIYPLGLTGIYYILYK